MVSPEIICIQVTVNGLKIRHLNIHAQIYVAYICQLDCMKEKDAMNWRVSRVGRHGGCLREEREGGGDDAIIF